jgi:hypothetical protein
MMGENTCESRSTARRANGLNDRCQPAHRFGIGEFRYGDYAVSAVAVCGIYGLPATKTVAVKRALS